MDQLSIEEKVVSIVIRNRISEKTFLNHKNKKALDFLYDTLDCEIPIPYDFIAKFVYELEAVDSEEEDERLNANITLLLKHYPGENQNILESNFNKIRHNYKLSIIQKEFIEKTIKGVRADTKKISDRLTELKEVTVDIKNNINDQSETTKNLKEITDNQLESMNKIKKEVESVEEIKSSIYTDFISILGVFSVFVFLMFGGIDVVRAVIDVADDLQVISLSRLIILSSLMLVAVLTLLYCLLLWIARITGKRFGECHKPDCQNGCKHKWKHFYYRHSFYFSMIIALILVVVVTYFVKFDFK
ncbi:hypothetical protein F6H99_07530 [Streptococcus anginosus]|uniref:hypothetical protein n=1 Tax=Streptococcus anginosus TaxID=1328 RepID=UPI001248B0B4|nr:hypothetical protein [Streptococcus anginosus]KAA9309502.1 hypothetical protein F6H99_07530 [Streptococcus anginosus]